MPTAKERHPGATTGGCGTNQYKVKSHPTVTAPASVALLEQANPKPVRCCDVWAGGCKVLVRPPDWTHGNHPDRKLRWQTAQSAFAPPEVLAYLAQSSNFEIQVQVASNRSTPPEALELLSHGTDSDYRVRSRVAYNPHTPTPALERLSRDHDYAVREGVAANPNTPLPLLQKLLRDQNGQVARTAAANPSLPAATLAMWQLTR